MSTFDRSTIDRISIEKRAHELRHQEISLLLKAAFAAFSDQLRRNHEQWLRLRNRRTRLATVNGTPA